MTTISMTNARHRNSLWLNSVSLNSGLRLGCLILVSAFQVLRNLAGSYSLDPGLAACITHTSHIFKSEDVSR